MNEYNGIKTPKEALRKLIAGNDIYLKANRNPANISPARRMETARHGQHPYAVVLTCSDSRVPPEHIFSAGIGDLFVVRTAGNVVGDFEIGTVEYGVLHLGAKIILVMGHSQCGAVAAALEGYDGEGYIEDVVTEIQRGLDGAQDECTAIHNNILHSKNKLMKSTIIRTMLRKGEIEMVCAKYDIATGKVAFFTCSTDDCASCAQATH